MYVYFYLLGYQSVTVVSSVEEPTVKRNDQYKHEYRIQWSTLDEQALAVVT